MNTEDLIKYLYLYWNTPDKSHLSKIKKRCMFKSYILTHPNIDDIIINKCIEILDSYFRYKYLIKKYSKLWLNFLINKKPSVNTTDLSLNVINTINPINTINYIDYKEKKRYIFTIDDFRKMAKNNLEHSYNYDMIPQPISIKNPYTNKEFKKDELKNINSKLFDMPLVWHMYVNCDYNIIKLRQKYYNFLQEMCVSSFVEQMDDDDIIFYLRQIFIYFDINYCSKCIEEKNHIKSNSITKIIKDWVLSINFNILFSRDYADKISKLYSIIECIHRPKIYRKSNKNIKNIINIDLSKPLFCVGYTNKEEDLKNRKRILRNKSLKNMRNKLKIIKIENQRK